MQAVILAAGKGTRLGNIIYQTPKPMIQIMGKPILEHNILLCKKFGITKIFINLHHLSDKIRGYFGDGSRWGVELIYKYEPELLGTAGAVKNFQEELSGQLFFVIYGDNYSDINLGDALSFHQEKKGIATIVLTPKEDVSNSGIAVLDNKNRIIRFIEKPSPSEQQSNLVNAGVYVLSPDIFKHLNVGFSDFGHNIFPNLIKRGENIYGIIMSGKLVAVDTPQLYLEATSAN